MKNTRRNFLKVSTAAIGLASAAGAAPASAHSSSDKIVAGLLGVPIVVDKPSRGAFPLAFNVKAAPIWHDKNDHKGVLRAIADLQNDTDSVVGSRPDAMTDRPSGTHAIIIGTVGMSSPIDALISEGKFDASSLKGKWESFVIATVHNPVPGIEQALVIAGSDKRGTIYGIYELSEQLGVSPWYWWADVPTKKRGQAFVKAGHYESGEPVVRYRGIFINDEAPCMTRWTNQKFGGFNSKMYVRMFELILRLRGNYLWPAMWDSAFNEDDPENPRLADEYGVVMGTSHHEPMVRAQKEWTKSHSQHGNGEWDYATNAEGLKAFWKEGIRRNRSYESLVTIGMRGDGDLAKPSAGGIQADIRQLETIMADQRRILADELNPDVTQVPQLWALFTEVQKIYDAGVNVPDDVTLLFTDDNVGNLRRLPTDAERKRRGGAGIYYHFDMHGGPFAYQWINTNPFPKIWEQMTLANEYGANRIWIVNVGDLKPLELPVEFFIRMAWNPSAISREQIGDYTRRWASRDFGADYANEIAEIVSIYAKYNGWRKPELVAPDTYSLANYSEAERVWKAWEDVTVRAEALYRVLPEAFRASYYQLVLHPAKASGIVVQMNIAAGRSQFYARQGRASANTEAGLARALFKQDQDLSDFYNHDLAGGKWNHMMDQTHLGEYTWQPPRVNMLPPVSEVLVNDTDDFGVAIDGSDSAWPDHYGDAVLPKFDSLNPRRSYIEVFAQGRRTPKFRIATESSWIRITEDASPGLDRRFWVEIDWQSAPDGESSAIVSVTGENTAPGEKVRNVQVHVLVVKASREIVAQAGGRFASLAGPIAIGAAKATACIPVSGAGWQPIPDYGRGDDAMTIVPVTTSTLLPPQAAPVMQYAVYLPRAGDYHVKLVLGPAMDSSPNRGVRIGVAFDSDPVQIVDIFANRTAETFLGPGWVQAAKDNARFALSTHALRTPGQHELKITMIDPGVVVQKLIIYDNDLPDSYFGPPDNIRI